MHASFRIKANFLHITLGLPEQGSTLVSQANSSTMKICVLRVVFHAVVNNKIKVLLELVKASVALGTDALPHGGEVHWMFNVVKVVRHLDENTINMYHEVK